MHAIPKGGSLKKLPKTSGVYLFKDEQGTVLYIGKAISLYDRVSSYFSNRDNPKVAELLDAYQRIDYIALPTEREALLLEADLIRTYQPKYNILLKGGHPFLYLIFTDEPLPRLVLTRTLEKGKMFGPFLHKKEARAVYEFLMRTFRLKLCNKHIEHGCLDYHIGLCGGSCLPSFKKEDYLTRLALAQAALSNNQEGFLKAAKEQMHILIREREFERAQVLQKYLESMETIFHDIAIRYKPERYLDDIVRATSPETDMLQRHTASALQSLLHTQSEIRTIDCFDISHFQSLAIVGSCIRFRDGLPDKSKFRRFNIPFKQQDDYAALASIVLRRYRSGDFPDLVLIDGGKGQLSAVASLGLPVNLASLAKKEERLYSLARPEGILLDAHKEADRILLAIRDYAHHFAITYHRLLRSKTLSK
jgi:excinuclease ABC subunit C